MIATPLPRRASSFSGRRHGGHPRHAGNAISAPKAFTLIEMVMGLAMTAVLMGAMVASVAVASRSIDPSGSPAGRTVQAAGVLEQIEADLALAMSFTEQTATAATFTVPDRNGDGAPETIRYYWMGAADGRLMKQVNAGSAAVIAQDVQQFNLTYMLKTVQARSP
jgi:type II secretory pathway component PulJ